MRVDATSAGPSGTSGSDRIARPWGDRTPYGPGDEWPARTDVFLADGIGADDVERWVRTASVLHSNGDAMDIAVAGGRIVGVRGRAEDRVNRGRLGPKDLYGWQANNSPDRLRRPLVREGGRLVETDWDTAMARVVSRTRELLDARGPSAIGFYTSGQLFLEEYYTLAAIGHGAIGTNHMDGNTRLCTATAAAALKETFACDGQPGSYTDVDHADVIAGQGTAAAELIEEVGELDFLFVCLGGGGLLAGSALAARAMSPGCKVYGVEPEAGNDGQQSLRKGEIVRIAPPRSIADGALTLYLGQLTFPIIRRDVTDIVTVSDEQLVQTMRFFAERMKMVVEPTGCLGASAALHGAVPIAGAKVGVIVSGGNVDLAAYARLIGGLGAA